jgi:streptogramin lyase
LWTANETGLLTRWTVSPLQYKQYRLPGEPAIYALTSDGQNIYAGTETGAVWKLNQAVPYTQVVSGQSGKVSALVFDGHRNLWYADANDVDPTASEYRAGRGIVLLTSDREKKIFTLVHKIDAESDPLRNVTALTFNPELNVLWAGTRSGWLFRHNIVEGTWQVYDDFRAYAGDNSINDLKYSSDGSLWVAATTGLSVSRNDKWEKFHLAEDSSALSLAIAQDNTIWVTGEHYIARLNPDHSQQVYHIADNPLLLDRVRFVVLDGQEHPWFVGRRGKIHFDGQTWIAYDADVRLFAHFTPLESLTEFVLPPDDFPSPTKDYTAWLKTWPRPEVDNGRGIHFLQSHQFAPIEAQRQIDRLQALGARWTLVHYADHDQIVRLAPLFQAAGITVVWRPFVRPYQTYGNWAEDVAYLRSRGIGPYIQLYNEPSLAQEWDEGQPIDQEIYLQNLLPAIQQVYEAGGYIGLQLVNPDWLRLTLQTMKAQGMEDVFDRLFFVPHLYGLNHPPAYDEDLNSVLAFRTFAQVLAEELGFVPVMIVGEGGWRPGEAPDNRYPAITETLHRDYHLAVFNWFRTGQLSNGQALPDYLFAFCPWLISDPTDPAAWFDNAAGDRTLTIEGVKTAPPFERRFSWDK